MKNIVKVVNCLFFVVVAHDFWKVSSFNGLSFQDNLGKPAPEKQNHSRKTNLDLLEQETASGSGILWIHATDTNYSLLINHRE